MNVIQKSEVVNVNVFRKKRIVSDMNQEDLAFILGVDRTTISKWETGICYPRSELLPRIASALNCTVDELLKSESTEAAEANSRTFTNLEDKK